jgi:hypothetical protein
MTKKQYPNTWMRSLFKIPTDVSLNETQNRLELHRVIHKNLPEEFRDDWLVAVRTCSSNGLISQFNRETTCDMGDLINYSFIWSESVQGHDYWKQYRDMYRNVSLNPTRFWNTLNNIEIVKFKI